MDLLAVAIGVVTFLALLATVSLLERI